MRKLKLDLIHLKIPMKLLMDHGMLCRFNELMKKLRKGINTSMKTFVNI